MFTLTKEFDDRIVLKYENQHIKVEFEPEYPEHIKNLDLDVGVFFRTPTYNGEFCIDWEGQKIIMTVAKYGDGMGGSMKFAIDKTPEHMRSLMLCLREWQKLYV